MELVFKFIHFWRNGAESTISVPGKYEVCSECDGRGTVLMDGLRGVAFSSDEMDEDPEFREAYMAGKYDTHCDVCMGKRVELVPDEDRLTKRQKILWNEAQRVQAEIDQEKRYERQMRERGIEW